MSVVHCKQAEYDVYIGRNADPNTGVTGEWGNPFVIGTHGDREQVVERYRSWLWKCIQEDRRFVSRLAELHGKVLGCWCAPQPCHGDVLVRAAAWAHEQLEAERRSVEREAKLCFPDQLTRFDIERIALTRADRMMLASSSASSAFGYALRQGWITQAHYDAAQTAHGSRWNYCGD